MNIKPGRFLTFIAATGMILSFLFQSLTDTERWIIIIFCLILMIIGILIESRAGWMFKEVEWGETEY